ncbi:hypothetical protein MIND_00209600 [Mycena indigotica]|uniref:Oxidoreductase AflY n=1 Tax=Mycena indigotica TaxID=2126181 RepID=A0A8H6T6I9_9AGAR|nr:uncharacterized protein MIND_00209600 [Mycena indigotica]KAF7311978.1 hypothetical protein MIND_00209600 [Mycena indigotica]
MAPFSSKQLAALWPLPGPQLTVETPSRYPGSTAETTKLVRKYLQKDFEQHHGFFNYWGAHNHTPFHLLVQWSLGGTVDQIEAIWEQHVAQERGLGHSPQPITTKNFSKHLGDQDYYQGYQYFFADLLLKHSPNQVLEDWIFSPQANYGGDKPDMLNRLFAGILHPMLYLGYGLEFSLPGLMAEGLAQACVHGMSSSVLVPKSMFKTNGGDTHAFTIVARILADDKFRSFSGNFNDVMTQLGTELQEYAAEWGVDGSDPKDVSAKVKELCFMNTMFYVVGGWRDGEGFHKADFTLLHLVTSAMTVCSYIAVIESPEHKSLFLRAYFIRSLAYFVAQGLPDLPLNSFFSADILTEFPDAEPDPSETAYPDASIPNLWFKVIQSSLVHPDDHLSKTQRTLAHFGSLWSTVPAGEFEDTELDDSSMIDGTLFVRAAALTMEWMGRIREGEPARLWANDPNFPESDLND